MIPDKIDILHFMMTPFTGLGLPGYRGDKWLENRIAIFKKFVLPTLLKQSNLSFIHWISWRPEEKSNPIVWKFKKYLDSLKGYRFVFTYNGTCFWDDKYPNDNLEERLKASLPVLKQYTIDHIDEIGKRSYVYLTIQPSDDMYCTDAVEQIQMADFAEATGYLSGYIYNMRTGDMADYSPITTPPFYTLKFDTDSFFEPYKHFYIVKDLKSHEDIIKCFDFKELQGKGFCVGVHGENISTTWALKDDITDTNNLINFGMLTPETIDIKVSRESALRQLFRKLPIPIQNIIKKQYYAKKQ